jgi:hypothetical protein
MKYVEALSDLYCKDHKVIKGVLDDVKKISLTSVTNYLFAPIIFLPKYVLLESMFFLSQ